MTTQSLEQEVKLDVELRYELPPLSGVVQGATAVARPLARLVATYYDTPDLRLLRRGMTLRQRTDRIAGGENLWTLKLPTRTTHAALSRDEFSWPGSQSDIPPEAVHLALGVVRHAQLVPVAKLLTTRRRTELRSESGERLVEVDDDLVSVMSGVREGLRFREVEVELGSADDDVLALVVARLTDAGATRGAPRPKLHRALGLGHLEAFDVESLGPESTLEDMVRSTLAAGIDRLVDHDPGIRVSEGDTEYVHQARVATRRLRSDLKTLAMVLDESWVDAQRVELQWLGGLLGAVRDADVLEERLVTVTTTAARVVPPADGSAAPDPEQPGQRGEPDALTLEAAGVTGLFGALASQRRLAHAALLEALDSPRYLHLLDELSSAVGQPPLRSTEHDTPAAAGAFERPFGTDPDQAGDHRSSQGEEATGAPVPLDPSLPAAMALPQLVARRWRKLRRAVRRAEQDPTDTLLHRVRIRAKQLRYAAEAAQPILGKRTRRLGESAAELQTVLGELHDAVAADAWLRQVARSTSAEVAFTAGQLSVLEQQRRAQYHASWHATWEAVASEAPEHAGRLPGGSK